MWLSIPQMWNIENQHGRPRFFSAGGRHIKFAARPPIRFRWILCFVLVKMLPVNMFTIKPSLNILLVPAAVSAVAIIVMFVLRGVVFAFLHKWGQKWEIKMDGLIVSLLKAPSIYWCLAIGLYIGIELSDLPRKYMFYVDRAIYIILIFSITLVLANLSVRVFENYVQKSNITIPATGIVFGVFKGTIIIAGMLVIFNVLGISITPLITALGVGGLAVALALKDTLSNLFAGLHIVASKEIRPGDYIKFDSGEEGTIKDITWRSTTVLSSANNIIIIPNAKVVAATITNYDFPDREVSVNVQVGAAYDAKKIMNETPGGVPGYEPSIRFHTLGDFSILFSVALKVKEFGAQYLVKHEFIKALHKRYVEEGISIPVKTVG
jgi:small-conductance mechanosensitive channel